jgi:hypothetical protein
MRPPPCTPCPERRMAPWPPQRPTPPRAEPRVLTAAPSRGGALASTNPLHAPAQPPPPRPPPPPTAAPRSANRACPGRGGGRAALSSGRRAGGPAARRRRGGAKVGGACCPAGGRNCARRRTGAGAPSAGRRAVNVPAVARPRRVIQNGGAPPRRRCLGGLRRRPRAEGRRGRARGAMSGVMRKRVGVAAGGGNAERRRASLARLPC